MSLLANLQTDDSIENETDTLGGNAPLDSGVYNATVTMAYIMRSQGGATGLVLHLMTDVGKEFRQTLWVTSGDAKGNKNYYTTKTGEKRYLPGFNIANSLTLLTLGKEIAQLDAEEKVIKVWSADEKKEVPTKMPVLTELLNQNIIAGIIKQVVDKSAKDGNGNYVPTGETREVAEIDKLFRHKDKLTTAEIRSGSETPEFYNGWKEKWTGQVRNRATTGSNTSGAKTSAAFAGTAKPKASLFANG